MENANVEKKVSQADLAQAFTGKPTTKATKKEVNKDKKPKKLIVSVVIFVIGLLALIAGAVVLILKYTSSAPIADGEYLTQATEWVLRNDTNCEEPLSEKAETIEETEAAEKTNGSEANCLSVDAVIWKFTEIGKGTLTTNAHLNDYDFIWAIDGDKLKVETKWLYGIVNEYEYRLDQNNGTLTLKDGEKEFVLDGKFAENQ